MGALWMPEGSVRALVFLILTLAICAMSAFGKEIHVEMWDLLSIMVAFYFGTKAGKAEANEHQGNIYRDNIKDNP